MNTMDAKCVLETALICAQQPLTMRELGVLFDGRLAFDTIRLLLDDLQNDWANRGVELSQVVVARRRVERQGPAKRPFGPGVDLARPLTVAVALVVATKRQPPGSPSRLKYT